MEGILDVEGLAEMIKARMAGKSRQALAFEMVKEICEWDRMKGKTREEILTLAIRVGLSVLTEGVVVASTEGIQRTEIHKNMDGSEYAAVLFAGPIRGAGGTSAALTVAMADYARKLLGIGSYRATQTEVERYLEEIQIYDFRVARLQYMPERGRHKAHSGELRGLRRRRADRADRGLGKQEPEEARQGREGGAGNQQGEGRDRTRRMRGDSPEGEERAEAHEERRASTGAGSTA